MPEFFGEQLPHFKEAAVATDEKLSQFIEYFAEQARYAFLRAPEKINGSSLFQMGELASTSPAMR